MIILENSEIHLQFIPISPNILELNNFYKIFKIGIIGAFMRRDNKKALCGCVYCYAKRYICLKKMRSKDYYGPLK